MRLSASEIWQWMLARRACSGHGDQNNQTEKNNRKIVQNMPIWNVQELIFVLNKSYL